MTQSPKNFELNTTAGWLPVGPEGIQGESSPLGLRYWQWEGEHPVLLLHGLADHGLVWANAAQQIGHTYQWVAPDLRGHGDSCKPETGYQCSDFVADLKALIKTLGWEKLHVIAHSWSCKLATLWAAEEPEKFLSLTLVDPFLVGTLPRWSTISFPILYKVLPFLKTMQLFRSLEDLEHTARQLKQYQGWSLHQQLVFQYGVEQKGDQGWSSKFCLAARNAIFNDIIRVEGLPKAIDVPTLLLLPEGGLNRFSWQLSPYQKYLTQLSIQRIPGNHWPFLVESDRFNAAIAEWLALWHR